MDDVEDTEVRRGAMGVFDASVESDELALETSSLLVEPL